MRIRFGEILLTWEILVERRTKITNYEKNAKIITTTKKQNYKKIENHVTRQFPTNQIARINFTSPIKTFFLTRNDI